MPEETRGNNQREHEIRREREQELRRSYTDAAGVLRADLRRQGILHVRGMRMVAARRARARHRLPAPGAPAAAMLPGAPGAVGVVGAQWVSIGPAPLRIDAEQIYQGSGPVSGLVSDIAIDPAGGTDRIIYIAALSGGVWKSTDGGTSWQPKMDALVSEAISAVALDPGDSSTVYAGTSTFTSMGLFKSTDGGETWILLDSALFSGRDIYRIVLPASDVLLVATDFGLFRSVDGGLHFGNNAPHFDNDAPVLSGDVTGLRLDTASPATTVLAAVSGMGLFRSTDAGVTFPTNLFANAGAPAAGTYAFVAFAQSTQPDAQTLYAYVQANPHRGLFKSVNGGATWSELLAGATCADQNGGAQLGYDQTLGVDPRNASRVYLGFQELYLSTDGGNTFGIPAISRFKIHWDHHALVFSPQSHWSGQPTRFYVGTDGGIATSADGGITFTNLNEGIGTNLFYGIDIGRGSDDSNRYTYGGCQDTGTVERRPAFAGRDWHLGIDGDGGPVAVDAHDPQRCYGSDDSGYIRTTDAGASWKGGGLAGHVHRLAVDPNRSAVVYALAVGNDLYQSTDSGNSFLLMHTFAAEVQSISIAALDSSTVWVGLADGAVARTHDALAGAASTWTTFSAGLPAGRSAATIAVDPSNPSRVVVGYDGVTGIPPTNRTRHVYLTDNDGASWNDISGTDGGPVTENLPDLPVSSVAIDADPSVGLFGACSGPGSIVAVGLFGTVLSSPDGAVWTAHVSGTASTLAAVVWGGGQFVAVGLGGVILTSPDASNWTVRKTGPSGEALQGVAYSGFRYVVTSASVAQVYTSTDGIHWLPQAVPGGHALLAVTWWANEFIAVGYGGTVLTSPDGLAWTVRASGTAENLGCVAASGNRIVAGGLNGAMISSPDGASWTVRPSGTGAQISGVARSGSLFVAVLNTGGVLTSPDGDVWTVRAAPTGRRLNDLAWSGSEFVAVGDFGSIFSSADGVSWADHSFGDVLHSILMCCDAGVLQTIDLGASWHVLGVGLPRVRSTALALDSLPSPSLLRVGTYGRSAWELETAPGPRLAIVASLAFGRLASGTSASLTARLYNVGSNPLDILSITRTSGSADFSAGGVALPATLAPGAEADLVVQLTPGGVGNRAAVFTIVSNDFVAPSQGLPASGTGF